MAGIDLGIWGTKRISNEVGARRLFCCGKLKRTFEVMLGGFFFSGVLAESETVWKIKESWFEASIFGWF